MDMKSTADAISVVPLADHEQLWQSFLAHSANGTLFHDLEFLRYHPPGRFRFNHIMLMRGGEPIALIPGGLVGTDKRPIFCSPLGASTGGLVLRAPARVETTLQMVDALQTYARDEGWGGIEITLPPNYYSLETADVVS